MSEFSMKAGDHKIIRVSVLDDDGGPLSLAGVLAIVWEMALYMTSQQQALVTKTLGSGIEIESPASSGIIRIALEPADTEAVAGLVRHELAVTDASGNRTSLAADDGAHYGVFEVEPQYIV